MNHLSSMFSTSAVEFVKPSYNSRDLSGKSGVYRLTIKRAYQNELTTSNGPTTTFNILADAEMVGNSDYCGRLRFTLFVPSDATIRDYEKAMVTDFMYLTNSLRPNAQGGYDLAMTTKEVTFENRTSTEVTSLEGVSIVVALQAVEGKNGYGPSLRPKAFFNQECYCTYELMHKAASAEVYKKFLYLNDAKELAPASGTSQPNRQKYGSIGYNMAPPAANPYAMTGGAPAPQPVPQSMAPAAPAAPAYNPYAVPAAPVSPYGQMPAAPVSPYGNPYPAAPAAPQATAPQAAPAQSGEEEIPF